MKGLLCIGGTALLLVSCGSEPPRAHPISGPLTSSRAVVVHDRPPSPDASASPSCGPGYESTGASAGAGTCVYTSQSPEISVTVAGLRPTTTLSYSAPHVTRPEEKQGCNIDCRYAIMGTSQAAYANSDAGSCGDTEIAMFFCPVQSRPIAPPFEKIISVEGPCPPPNEAKAICEGNAPATPIPSSGLLSTQTFSFEVEGACCRDRSGTCSASPYQMNAGQIGLQLRPTQNDFGCTITQNRCSPGTEPKAYPVLSLPAPGSHPEHGGLLHLQMVPKRCSCQCRGIESSAGSWLRPN